jgi:hypothetical protein
MGGVLEGAKILLLLGWSMEFKDTDLCDVYGGGLYSKLRYPEVGKYLKTGIPLMESIYTINLQTKKFSYRIQL